MEYSLKMKIVLFITAFTITMALNETVTCFNSYHRRNETCGGGAAGCYTIINRGTWDKTFISSHGCAYSAYCGKSSYIKNTTLETICCCNTSYCNDDAFVEKCKKRAESKPFPRGIKCHSSSFFYPSGVNCTAYSSYGVVNDDKCAVVIHGNNVLKNGCSSGACNSVDDNLSETTCCCNTTNCNDDAFVEKCKERAASKPKIITCLSLLPDSDKKKCSGSAEKNKCFVTIHGHETIGKGCITDGGDCGFVAGKYASCCCNTTNCNDDAFVEKCKTRAISTTPSQSKELRCFNSVDQHKSISNGDFAEKCSPKLFYGGSIINDKCAVAISRNSIFNRCSRTSCIPPVKNACCCDTPYCNDEAFVEKCKARYAPKPWISCRSSLPDIDEHNCSVSRHVSLNENECFVTISGNRTIRKGCKLEVTDCDIVAGNYTVCCCNTTNCNDDAFVEKCKARTLPTAKPERFSCLNSASQSTPGVSAISQECSDPKYQGQFDNTCMVTRTGADEIVQSCLPKNKKSECGTWTSGYKVCCCSRPNCNDQDSVISCNDASASTTRRPNTWYPGNANKDAPNFSIIMFFAFFLFIGVQY